MRRTPQRPGWRLATAALAAALLVAGPAAATSPSAGAGSRTDLRPDPAGRLAFKRSAPGKIVLFKSVAGIELGMTRQAVLKRLGNPSEHTEAHEDFYHAKALQLDVRYTGGGNSAKVSLVGTRAPSIRTSKGIHPGSSLKALKKAYAKRGIAYDPSTLTWNVTNSAGITTYFGVSNKGEVFSISVGTLS